MNEVKPELNAMTSQENKLISIEPTKTYATRENAIKAFEKKCGGRGVRYMIMIHTDGRFFPVALGEDAVQEMVHFHFNVIA